MGTTAVLKTVYVCKRWAASDDGRDKDLYRIATVFKQCIIDSIETTIEKALPTLVGNVLYIPWTIYKINIKEDKIRVFCW